MSSRFLKKVSKTYGSKSTHPEKYLENNSSSEEDRVPDFSNKFDLLQMESESDSEKNVIDKNSQEFQENLKINKEKKKKMKLKKSISKKQSGISKPNVITEDELLDELSSTMPQSPDIQDINNNSSDVLSIKIRNLNENLELQQMFGPSAVNTTAATNHGRRNNHLSLLKCTFGKRGPDWPQLTLSKLGLEMKRTQDVSSGYNWCIVTCSESYLRGERALKTAMRTGNFQDHLREWPYHVNSLLQMVMLLINQEDFSIAADILKRIFYVYETISPMGLSLLGFNSGGSLTRGNCSLDYRYRLNRGIFLALFQWIHYLCQRSCFTTALEYCKVIINLNVVNDPLAMILMIDDIAIRANQFDFLIQFGNQFHSSKSLTYLPNFAFSLPLCHFLKSSSVDKIKKPDVSQADILLQNSLSRFPSFLTAFVDHCNIKVDSRVDRSTLFTNSNDSVPLTALIKLYMKRSINLWKNAAVLRWVECNVQRLLDRFDDVKEREEMTKDRQQVTDIYKTRVIPLAVKRHLFLSGYEQLIDDSNNAGSTSITFDPYPPANSEGGFDHYYETDVQTELDESWIINLFRSFMPSFR